MLRIVLIIVPVLAVAVLAACGSETESSGGRVRVVATTTQLQDFAREVGGARVHVKGLLGPGTDPHEYEPKPSDADAVSGADVVIANGAGLDHWLGGLLDNGGGGVRRVDAARGLATLRTGEKDEPSDPHVWHDPELAKRMVDRVALALTREDPAGRRT